MSILYVSIPRTGIFRVLASKIKGFDPYTAAVKLGTRGYMTWLEECNEEPELSPTEQLIGPSIVALFAEV